MGRALVVVLFVLAVCSTAGDAIVRAQPVPLQTNVNNFYLRGTQPGGLEPNHEIITAVSDCIVCHSRDAPIYDEWSGSLMAQAARDPVFYAGLDVANANAPGAGDFCIRCHAPKAWLEGRATPPSGANITAADRDAITCNFCHRMVDPFDVNFDAPAIDYLILLDLGADAPVQSWDLGTPADIGFGGSASYVVDPFDRRRGPFPIGTGPGEANCEFYHPEVTYESPFHRRSELCATCHDVSPPHFSLNATGTGFEFNGFDVRHPDGNKYNMVPAERTFSEWLKSDFAVGSGVDMGGRFGGRGAALVSSCQDCHMPRFPGQGCFLTSSVKADLPHHFFSGAATWQLNAIDALYGDDPPGTLSPNEVSSAAIDLNIRRNLKMLKCAADLDVSLDDSLSPGIFQLKVRVINQTGHKLPTGFPEGRRIWVNVRFFDCTDSVNPMMEHGAYDETTGTLVTTDSKVYEMRGGMDDYLAALTNRVAGPHMHFVLTNKVFSDNRIPPRGFTNSGFAAVLASPVAYAYADGQYWDDTYFDIPPYAVGAKVTLYYQATSKAYIEMLRDDNPGFPAPDTAGQRAYDLWLSSGGLIPVTMAVFPPQTDPADPCDDLDEAIFNVCQCPEGPDPAVVDPDGDGLFSVDLKGDLNGDRLVTVADLPDFVRVLAGLEFDPRMVCAADMDGLNGANGEDIGLFVADILSP